MQAMLLAAGLGTRLRPYTLIRPKPLFPVLNQPLLTILLDMLCQAGCERIVVNSHHLAEQVEKAIEGRKGLFYQHEPEILGTGGSLRKALLLFSDEPILVMNGDIFHTVDLKKLYEQHVRSGNKITMAMHDCARFNTVTVRNGFVRTFSREPIRNGEETLAFTGIHVTEPSVIRMIPGDTFFHVIDLYEELARKEQCIGCLRVDGSLWRDIGTVEDYLHLHATLLTGMVPQTLPVAAPKTPWLVSAGARIGTGVELSGWGCVGEAVIGHNVTLHNCIVWDQAIIPDGTCLTDKIVSPGLFS